MPLTLELSTNKSIVDFTKVDFMTYFLVFVVDKPQNETPKGGVVGFF